MLASIQQNYHFLVWIILNIQYPCTGLIQNLVRFSLQDNRNEIRQAFQVWDSRKIATWPAKPQVLGDHVSNYTTENQFPEWITVNIQKFGQFPIWIIATSREEGTLTALNYEV